MFKLATQDPCDFCDLGKQVRVALYCSKYLNQNFHDVMCFLESIFASTVVNAFSSSDDLQFIFLSDDFCE